MAQSLLGRFGIALISHQNLSNLKINQQEAANRHYELLSLCEADENRFALLREFKYSHAQNQQDLFALAFSGLKEGGFFVEFGATDGKQASNTYLLETRHNWNGVLAEPSKEYWAELKANRRATLSNSAVSSKSGETLAFVESGQYSSLSGFFDQGNHKRSNRSYLVRSISLMDLLSESNAPEFIDFLSIDTEGSEFEILNAFDFNKYRFGFICVEHNFKPAREDLHELLKSHGYLRVLEHISNQDDFYILS